MMSRRKYLLAGTVLVALIPLTIVGLHFRAMWQLDNYKKGLIATGEKLEAVELAPQPSGDVNAGTRLIFAVGHAGHVSTYLPPQMRGVKSGRAQIAWKQVDFPDTDSKRPGARTNLWIPLRHELTNAVWLGEIKAAVMVSNVGFGVDYGNIGRSVLAHLPPLKTAALALAGATLLNLHDGNSIEAYGFLQSLVATGEVVRDEPTMISQMVRTACLSIAASTTWEALQSDAWNDQQLADLQKQWATIDLFPITPKTLAMERATGIKEFNAVRDSYGTFHSLDMEKGAQAFADWDGFAQEASVYPVKTLKELIGSYQVYLMWKWVWSYEDEQLLMQLYQEGINAIHQSRNHHELLSRWDQIEKVFGPLCQSQKYKIAGATGTLKILNSYFRKLRRMQTDAQLVIAAVALKRFEMRNRRFPNSLAELVPAFLPQVPVDFMDGNPLRYRLNTNGAYLLYSVGDDRIDNGGDGNSSNDGKPSFFRGKDFVWPLPATTQEIKEAKEKK
jgi:hypothetical protein